MRILHVNTARHAGGAAQVAGALTAAQRTRGLDAEMLSGRPEPGTPEPGQAEPGGTTMSRPRFLANVLAYRVAGVEAPFERGRWDRILSERLEAADVVHLHNAHGYYLPERALADLLRRPCVWTLHDLWLATGRCATPQGCERWRTGCAPCPHPGHYPAAWHDRSGRERTRRRALIAETRAHFTVPSHDLAARVAAAGVPFGRLHVVPNPLLGAAERFDAEARRDARRRLGWPEDRCIALIAAGKLSDPNKNVATALAGLARVARPGRWFVALLGRPDRAMRGQIARLPMRVSTIETPVDRTALCDAYLGADILLNPSRGESFGMTNLEALAHGCRVACSDLPVFREVAGEAAAYLPPDDANAWAAALDGMLAEWPWPPDMALAARLRGLYALDAVVESYLALYRRDLA